MLRMAVCDKEEETCSLIKALAEESIGCKVWTFHSDTELLESKEKYDILLLDIGNGEPTGIETARKIRRCYDPILIFIAEGKKHVLDVFDVEAFHYLLKPIDEEKLKEIANEYVENIEFDLNQLKSEVIKEFAERLKTNFNKNIRLYGRCTVYDATTEIDDLVKEMTEEKDES